MAEIDSSFNAPVADAGEPNFDSPIDEPNGDSGPSTSGVGVDFTGTPTHLAMKSNSAKTMQPTALENVWETRLGLQISTKFTGWFESSSGSFENPDHNPNPKPSVASCFAVKGFVAVAKAESNSVRVSTQL